MSAWPGWMNHDRHPANLAELAEGETPSAICVPLRPRQQCPKISKRATDYPEGRGLIAAMVATARLFALTGAST